MSKTLLVCGYGPGISTAVAKKFGAEGYSVGIVARTADKLGRAVEELGKSGIKAKAFPADLGDFDAVKATVAAAREALGPITALHWNAYTGSAGDLTKATRAELLVPYDVSVTGLVAATQAAHADLAAAKGAILVTGGGLAFYEPSVDTMAVNWGAMGLALGKAAQHKLVGLLHEKLKADGIYVGEVVVLGMVKGTAFDTGNATLDPNEIAAKFWQISVDRAERSVNFG